VIFLIIVATLLDYVLGDPRGFPHPVILIGRLIAFYQRLFYKFKNKRLFGFIFAFFVLFTVSIIVWLVVWLSSFNVIVFFIVNTFILYTSLSCKSLKDESKKVIVALNNDDIVKAREYLSFIVGRDTQNLNKEQILKAVIETVAENTIDGIIAVLFYIILGSFFNLSAVFVYLYKAANTLDSMVGYKNKKYLDFGFASAKLDDILNFIPARLGSLIMLFSGILLGLNVKEGFRIFIRDRKNHLSPNSAHPESIVAGLLGVQLGGGNYYFGKFVSKPYIGDNIRQPTFEDIKKVYHILDISVIIILVGVVLLWIFLCTAQMPISYIHFSA
jgi:adenosylcobinamide-phosphate synthase